MSRVLVSKFFFCYAAYETALSGFRQYCSWKCDPFHYQFDRESRLYGPREENYEIYYDGKTLSADQARAIIRKYEEKKKFLRRLSPIYSTLEFVTNIE